MLLSLSVSPGRSVLNLFRRKSGRLIAEEDSHEISAPIPAVLTNVVVTPATPRDVIDKEPLIPIEFINTLRRQKTPHEFSAEILEHVILRVSYYYQMFYKLYFGAKGDEKKYYLMRLNIAKNWTRPEGYVQLINDTQQILNALNEDSSKELYSALLAESDRLNYLGVFYESVQAADAFYAMSHLLQLTSSTLDIDQYKKIAEQCRDFFFADNSIDTVFLEGPIRGALLQAIEGINSANNIRCIKEAQKACDELAIHALGLLPLLQVRFNEKDRPDSRRAVSVSSSSSSLLISSSATSSGYSSTQSGRKSSSADDLSTTSTDSSQKSSRRGFSKSFSQSGVE